MQILAITTSSKNCSVALLKDDKLIDEINIDNEKTHSETLMPLMEQILTKNKTLLSNIDYIACDIGPGSFTGIRIGVASCKAIAEVKKIPLCPVSSLEGLSEQCNPNQGLIVSLIDARNDQAYCGIFNADHSLNTKFFADSILNIIEILKEKNMPISFVGNASIIHKNLLSSSIPNSIFSEKNDITAFCIAQSAIKKIKKKQTCNADALLPHYLRKSQAERMSELKNGKS